MANQDKWSELQREHEGGQSSVAGSRMSADADKSSVSLTQELDMFQKFFEQRSKASRKLAANKEGDPAYSQLNKVVNEIKDATQIATQALVQQELVGKAEVAAQTSPTTR